MQTNFTSSRLFFKKIFASRFGLLFIAFLVCVHVHAQWVQKADFGGGERWNAVGFSIGSKGYIGTGLGASMSHKDFWEYDPTNNTWTQKADFGGTQRFGAVGFAIGSKGYIGTGYGANSAQNDFWEYDPAGNSWTQKADFGGTGRYYAVGFAIGSKGYIGTGYDANPVSQNDFWEYDPSNNTWIQKADVGGTERSRSIGFSIGSKGYIGTGVDNNSVSQNDFWEYDQTSNNWTQKADFGGTARKHAAGFIIGSKGYVGTGADDNSVFQNDFWEYDQTSNNWAQKADFGGTARFRSVGFSIGSKGYIGTGVGSLSSNNFWEYTPSSTPPTTTLSGNIHMETGGPISNVIVTITGVSNGYTATTYTDMNGDYSFPNVPDNDTYSICCDKNTDPLNGISTYDAVLIQKHILAIQPLGSPYTVIGANVTTPDQNVSVADLIRLRQLILGIISDFPGVPSWRFIPADIVLDPNMPYNPPYAEHCKTVTVAGNTTGVNFIGVKSGDANNSAVGD